MMKYLLVSNRSLYLLSVWFICCVISSDGFASPLTRSTKALRALEKRNYRLMMVSVGGGGGFASPNPPQQRPGFIISPSQYDSMSEMMIIDNFNQIQLGGSKTIGVIGSQEISAKHEQMIELLSYALVLSGNHIYTSGGGATNLAAIRGALRACNGDLLTVVLPQSLSRQPEEMQPLLMRVINLIEQPQNDDLDFKEAASQCNDKILNSVDEALVFCYHNSGTILNSVEIFRNNIEITTFYLD